MYLISDISNLIWTSLQTGIDKEDGRKITVEGKDVQINSARYAFDNAMDFLIPLIKELGFTPRRLICVEETGNSTGFRRTLYPAYKVSSTPKAPELLAEFNKARDLLREALLPLGAQYVTQEGVEGDDIIAYLALQIEEGCIIVSTDKDMQACISPKCQLWHKGQFNQNRLGPFPVAYTTIYKALVGDPGDKIKGAHKFGEVSFLDLYCLWGDEGLDEVTRLVKERRLEELAENVPALKALQRVIDDREGVYVSWDLAKLYPDRVNTMRRPLVWTVRASKAGAPVDQRLAQWAPKQKLVHLANYEATLAWFKEEVKKSPFVAFDIETTCPQESLDWLAARARKTDEDGAAIGIDTLGQTLVGASYTLGDNGQFTLYMGVNHNESDGLKNLSKEQAAEFIKAIPKTTPIVVQNASFELTVLKQEWNLGDNGWNGFVPNVHDTKILSSMVDENSRTGLKERSASILNYTQMTYAEVTGGKQMHQLSATEVFNYGADDAICTAALYNHYRLVMSIEKTWDGYLAVDQMPAYLTAEAFVQGTPISMATLLEQEKADKEAYAVAWAAIRDYLISKGWPGSVPPVYTSELTAVQIKEAYEVVTGGELKTMVRTPAKLVAMIRAEDDTSLLAPLIEKALEGDATLLTQHVQTHFKGEPNLNMGSPKQIQTLLYGPNYMALPVRITNKPTDAMRAAGLKEGSPSTDNLALNYAMEFDAPTDEVVGTIIKALQVVSVTGTRMKMFYEPYRHVLHWKTGLVHPSLNQRSTNTGRYSSSSPNIQQLPKKISSLGEAARFREVFVPHRSDAVIVSMDFSGQELRIIAEYSQDPNMLACFVGDDLKDMHSLTAVGILARKVRANKVRELMRDAGLADDPHVDAVKFMQDAKQLCTYEAFKAALDAPSHPLSKLLKATRATAKTTNFGASYGAMAKKMGRTLMVSEQEAQLLLDAKLEAFGGEAAWKEQVIRDVKSTGTVRSMCGGVRHLGPALLSKDGYTASKADRQAVNFLVQGSAAEMSKLALTRLWNQKTMTRFSARFVAPIHDEIVFSVPRSTALECIREVHAAMVAPFSTMKVPVVSSIAIGRNFGELIEVGETVDDVRVEGALAELFK